MTLIAIINDTHAGVRNSSPAFIENQRKFYEEVFFPELEKRGIKKIVHLGDYYEHRRYVNFLALKANREHYLDHLERLGIYQDMIPGNHDVYFKNTNEVSSLDEILGSHPRINIIKEPTVIHNSIMMVPWLNFANHEKFLNTVENSNVPYCFGHFEFKGFEMHKGYPSTTGMSPDRLAHFDKVLSGHFHTKSTKGNVTYLGAQLETTWHDCDDAKYFHIFDTETGDLTPIRNPNKMFIRIPYNDEKFDYEQFDVSIFDHMYVNIVVVKKTNFNAYNRFLDRIEQRPIHDLKTDDTTDEFSGDNVETSAEFVDTPELMNNYIDAVDTPLDKGILKSKLSELYVRAQTEGDAE